MWFLSRLLVYVCFILLVRPGSAEAENSWPFDLNDYQRLVPADSREAISPGSVISLSGWQKYRDFLPIGMRALFSQQFHWKITNDPHLAILVGPTLAMSLPYQYRVNTAKYADTVRLEGLPTGGYTVAGYIAGLPFPAVSPGDVQAGIKLLYDHYYGYQPTNSTNRLSVETEDRMGNRTTVKSRYVTTLFNHISEENTPIRDAMEPGYFVAYTAFIEAPEQSRYTVELALVPDDPARQEEVYLFLPSLRRALRLSAAARCGPQLGADLALDDIRDGLNIVPADFSVRLIGTKKILHQWRIQSFEPAAYNQEPPGWPKPIAGRWEMRDVYVLDIRPLHYLHGYCYASRIVYLDTATFLPVALDLFDKSLRLWKVFDIAYQLAPVGDSHASAFMYSAGARFTLYDLINSHATFGLAMEPPQINDAVPKHYRDAAVWATPGGLAQIMK